MIQPPAPSKLRIFWINPDPPHWWFIRPIRVSLELVLRAGFAYFAMMQKRGSIKIPKPKRKIYRIEEGES